MDIIDKSVAVILGTYNGEKYLENQIESILKQKDVSIQIFARDDGSTDRTIDILKKYAKQHRNFHLMNNGKTVNKGVRDGFMEALKWAFSYSDNLEYFAFSDQDDIWLPDKLTSAVKKIRGENINGSLYYSNKTIVEENLKIRYTENFEFYNDFYDFYFVSKAYGCTLVINRRLAELSLKFVSDASHYHDDWIHRLAICLKAEIAFDKDSHILYRQHDSNQCGVIATESKGLMHLIRQTFNYMINGGGHNRAKLARDIMNHYNDLLDADIMQKLGLIANYNQSLRNKIILIKRTNIKKRPCKEQFVWMMKVLLGYF